jgi:hypothetical protein
MRSLMYGPNAFAAGTAIALWLIVEFCVISDQGISSDESF